MAYSKYISTKETTHAARVSRLLVDPCTDLFRDILRNHVTEIQFAGVLQKEERNLKPILNKVQREILYPKSGNFLGTYGEFDLSLLYILLRNISGITPHQRGWAKSPYPSDRCLSANIDRIREIRNTYCGHAVSVSLSDTEFQKLWQDLTIIVSQLEGTLPGGCTTYTDAAKMIKTVTMDPEQEKKFLDIIDQQHQTTEDIKAATMELKKTQVTQISKLDKLQSEFKRQGQKRKAEKRRQRKDHNRLKQKQNDQETDIKKLQQKQKRQRTEQKMQRIELSHISTNLAKEVPDSEGKNILENTLALLKAKELKMVNIRTAGVHTTVEKLRESHIAILTGKGGTGKTTTAYQVMREMSDPSEESPYTPVLIKSPEQWDKVINPTKGYLVFLDDVFGSTNLDNGAVEKWKNQLDVIFSCAKSGNVMVLIGLRRNVLDETRKYYAHTIFNDENIVDLSSQENLTIKDKENILEAYEDICNFKASELSGDIFYRYSKENGLNAVYRLSVSEKEEILFAKPYYGFPLTCFQFFSRRDFFQLGPSYFQHPDAKLFEAIENMRRAKYGNMNEKVKYCVLCYVFINGSIEANRISQTLLKTICEKLKIFEILEIDIKDAINDLNGLFLSKLTTKDLYEFSHETILETVLVSFGQLAPNIVIERCSREKLHELIRTENYNAKPCEVVLKIPRRHYEDLAQRLIRDDDGDGEELMDIFQVALDVMRHPGCEDPEFVSVFCNRGMTERLLSLYRILGRGRRVVIVLKGHKILFRELLERYGPHHVTSAKQIGEPTFKITIKHLNKLLLCNFNRKSAIETILPYISKYRYLPGLRGLLHTTSYTSLTALHYCVLYGWKDLVNEILEIHTPQTTVLNWSCVHLAAYAGRSCILQKLIKLRHDITERTFNGYSVLQTALLGLRYGHQDVFFPSSNIVNYFYLQSLFSDIVLSFPESKEYKNVIDALLTKNAQCKDLLMAVDEYENNITHYLVMYNYNDILDCLLQYDKEFVFQRNISDLPTALHVAVYLGRPEMVRKLWTLGVRPRDSDLSLMETRCNGARFSNRVIFYGALKSRDFKNWWNKRNDDSDVEALHMKLKVIKEARVIFGNLDEFQNVHDFLLDKVEL